MLVFFEERLVILATPKTGSTALAAALGPLAEVAIQRPPLLKHTNVHRYRRFVGPYLEAAAKAPFTVVALMREPVDWLGSWYRFRRRDDTVAPEKSTHGLSFDEFVLAWCRDPRPAMAEIGAQSRFLAPENGSRPDLLFRYEDMDGFVDFLEDRLGCEIVLPRVNVSPKGDVALGDAARAALLAAGPAEFDLYARLLAAKGSAFGALAFPPSGRAPD